jgi:hypothetical protein
MAPISTSTLALGAFHLLVSVFVPPALSAPLASFSIPVTVSGSIAVTVTIATLRPITFVAVVAIMALGACVLFFGGGGSGGIEECFNVET